MEKLFFILTSLIFFCANAKAQTNLCAKIPINPEIQVLSSYGKLQYNASKNTTQLVEKAKEYNYPNQSAIPAGLATVDISTDITVNSIGAPQNNGKLCVYPTKVSLFIGFTNPTIYLSNTLKSGTCEYNTALYHEQTHQYINKEMLDYFLPLFHDAFTKIIFSTSPIEINGVNEVDSASKQLTNKYNQKLSPLVEFFKQEMISEQKYLDNEENYRYENTICP